MIPKLQSRVRMYSVTWNSFLVMFILQNVNQIYCALYRSANYTPKYELPSTLDYYGHLEPDQKTNYHNPRSIDIPRSRWRPIVIKPEENHTATVIFLHDFGEDATYYTQYAMYEIQLPFMKVICPNAKYDFISYGEGHVLPSWFNFNQRHFPQEEHDVPGIKISTKYIHNLIRREIKCGIPSDRIIIGGFSQGGTLALHVALTFTKRLAGVFALSPLIPDHDLLIKTITPANKDIPIFQGHITSDIFTPNNSAYMITDYFKEYFSKDVWFREYEKGYQLSTQEQFDDLLEFFKYSLSGNHSNHTNK